MSANASSRVCSVADSRLMAVSSPMFVSFGSVGDFKQHIGVAGLAGRAPASEVLAAQLGAGLLHDLARRDLRIHVARADAQQAAGEHAVQGHAVRSGAVPADDERIAPL